MSEAKRVAGRARLRAVKLSMLILGRRERKVEWCGGGGSFTSAKVWSGVFGSSMSSKPAGAKFLGKVIDMPDVRRDIVKDVFKKGKPDLVFELVGNA